MKKTTLFLLCLISFAVSAQINNSVNGIESVKVNAEKWFKEVYVETNFKDPYSYQLMKIIVTPIDVITAINDSIKQIQYQIDTCSLKEGLRTNAEYNEWNKLYLDCINKIKAEDDYQLDHTSEADVTYSNKKKEIHKKYAIQALGMMKRIDLFNLNIKMKNALEQYLATANQSDLNKLAYYQVKIDCYSNNSLGNKVLGRFLFPFSKHGPIGSNYGINSVVQTNQ